MTHANIEPHLSLDKVRERFRSCSNATEKIHWQVILLRQGGRGTVEVAEICGYKVDWVRRLVRRYNTKGPDSLEDRRRYSKGRRPLLSSAQIEDLREAVLQETPPGGGLWTGPKVAQWMKAKLNRPVSNQRAWDYLQRLGMSKQTPRPRNARASAEEQTSFKKNFDGVWGR